MTTYNDIRLFVDGTFYGKKHSRYLPRIGETIVLDCGFMVKVMEVNYDWDDMAVVQIKSTKTGYKCNGED